MNVAELRQRLAVKLRDGFGRGILPAVGMRTEDHGSDLLVRPEGSLGALGEEFLRRSGPKDRQALREQNPGVFMRAGNALTNLTSEESYNRNYKKPKEGN